MADDLPNLLKEELTCHICTEIYTDPVQLLCQHSFCRECLKLYVSSDTSTDIACKSEQAVGLAFGDVKHSATHNIMSASCPVCRMPVELDVEAISKMPVHFTIANIVGKYRNEVKNDGSPKCSMCEGDQQRIAVKGCVTCRCLYCQDCFSTLHPMRGPFSIHTLVDAVDYASTPMCEEHNERLRLFCVDCKKLQCSTCAYMKHKGHDLREPDAVLNEEKNRMSLKTRHLEKLQQELQRCGMKISSVDDHIMNCYEDQAVKVEADYQKTLKALQNWKSECLGSINDKRSSLYKQTDSETQRLDVQVGEMMACMKSANDLARETDSIRYLLVSETTIQRMDTLSSTTDDILETFKNSIKGIEDALKTEDSNDLLCLVEENDDQSMVYRVIRQPIHGPKFSFQKEMHKCVSVQDDGKCMKNVHHCWEEQFHGALANQSYQAGRLYWETDLCFSVTVEQFEDNLVYSAGVLHQNKPLPMWVGDDIHSWGVTVQQRFPYIFNCYHNKVSLSDLPVHPDVTNQDRPIRLGFYLDCINKTLSILDCTYDRILHTFHNVDLSEPLTPAVAVYNFASIDVSVRLRTGEDIVCLPKCLYNLLHRY